ncbi:hypothetical protein BKA70DRAFT_1418747 [Coprinopsis sp. MPI-PUGE-AT-0042]|nr:hypothetical protein BKA70DRAFT_1418747 [Coprinopsis sp. MPI-PUGE-AT-0042]
MLQHDGQSAPIASVSLRLCSSSLVPIDDKFDSKSPPSHLWVYKAAQLQLIFLSACVEGPFHRVPSKGDRHPALRSFFPRPRTNRAHTRQPKRLRLGAEGPLFVFLSSLSLASVGADPCPLASRRVRWATVPRIKQPYQSHSSMDRPGQWLTKAVRSMSCDAGHCNDPWAEAIHVVTSGWFRLTGAITSDELLPLLSHSANPFFYCTIPLPQDQVRVSVGLIAFVPVFLND